MIVLIDNYDSFSYNLYQYLGELAGEVRVIRNDELTTPEIRWLEPEALVLSPGPGRPEQAGMLLESVKDLKGKMPILGVCLGHQAICQAFGGTITYAERLMHGKQSRIRIDQKSPIFAGLPQEIDVARYHSLAAEKESLPDCLSVIGETAEGEIMAVQHKEYEIYGVQFHPESILTPDGKQILKNFLGGTKK